MHQRQTQGTWWHPKSLWLIHAGPQAFAPWCHMVKHLPPPGFAPQPDSTSKNSSCHLNRDRLELMEFLTGLFYANLFYPFPHWDSLAFTALFTSGLFTHVTDCLFFQWVVQCGVFSSLFQCFCISKRIRWQEIGAPQRRSNCDKWDYVRLCTYRKQYKQRNETNPQGLHVALSQ